MTTSGTHTYNPSVAEMFEEAFEQAGVDPGALGGSHVKSAARSLRLLLNSEWSMNGIRRWQVAVLQTHTTAVGEVSFTLPPGGIDIIEASLRRSGSVGGIYSDVEMYPISESEYLSIVNKQTQGRPDRYWVQRGSAARTVYYWQAGSNTTDQVVYNMLQSQQDVTGNISDTLDLPSYAIAALVAGLAARLALKHNPAKYGALQTLYAGPNWAADPLNPGGLLGMLRAEDRERGDIQIQGSWEPRLGRRS